MKTHNIILTNRTLYSKKVKFLIVSTNLILKNFYVKRNGVILSAIKKLINEKFDQPDLLIVGAGPVGVLLLREQLK